MEAGDREKGMAMTKQFEGWRPFPYQDTRGYNTIGWGFNMDANPSLFSEEVRTGKKPLDALEAEAVFQNFYKEAEGIAQQYAGDRWGYLTPNQQNILVDMGYNLNRKLFQFQQMQKALMRGDNEGVVREMKNSNWYKQVGNRSKSHIANWGN